MWKWGKWFISAALIFSDLGFFPQISMGHIMSFKFQQIYLLVLKRKTQEERESSIIN